VRKVTGAPTFASMPDTIERLNAALEGRYRVARMLGEGGMATVWLADDLRHERQVALKVLKPELAAVVGAERFLAEIKTTANLHHPHILPLFDSGEANGFLFYVMPYVDDETLRGRLDRDRQLPVDEAVAITSAVAQALQHAHDRGVIHRDIKPANILLQDGQPVVSDFGIALAVGAGNARLTETGLSLGTPYYMSPEQATGDQHVGPASDIYALAAVLYEMLTGDPPYVGSTAQAVLGKILQGAPVSATAARSSVPAHVDAAIRKGLEKLPADRFQSAKDFAKALADPTFRHGAAAGAAAAGAGPWKRVALACAAVAVVSLAMAGTTLVSDHSDTAPPVTRFTVPLGDGAFLGGAGTLNGDRPAATSLALSPDGSLLVFAAFDTTGGGTHSRLYLKRIEQERAEVLPNTEGAAAPFFSPEGDWIGFYAGRSIRKVPVAGGDAVTVVADANPFIQARGATWGDDGTIAYTGEKGVWVVPASGGEPKLVTGSDSVRGIPDAHFLTGRNVLLLTVWPTVNPKKGEIVALDLDGGTRKQLLTDAMNPVYVQPGYLLFMRRGTLMGVPFDTDRLETSGAPFIVAEDVMQALAMPNGGAETGAAQLAVSRAGHLAYATGGVYPQAAAELVHVKSDGSAEPLAVPRGPYLHVRASPTGDRIAYNVEEMRALSIRVFDRGRGVTQALSPGGYSNPGPLWSPDGRMLAFTTAQEDGTGGAYRVPVDGNGTPERLAARGAVSWSVNGDIAYMDGGDVWVLPPGGEPKPFLTAGTQNAWATFSPDGHWIAYGSNQTGSMEVYVRPYPAHDPATKVSVSGGGRPAWSRDGKHLYFVARVSARPVMMVADVATEPDFRVDRVRSLIDPWSYRMTGPMRSYDVLPDGSFVAVRDTTDRDSAFALLAAREIHVVLNFAEELKRRARQ
jgi:eukaryotic-like serine/threonine-protein kinase